MSIEEILGPLVGFEHYVGRHKNKFKVMICWQQMLPGDEELVERSITGIGNTEEEAAEEALARARDWIRGSSENMDDLLQSINRHLGNL